MSRSKRDGARTVRVAAQLHDRRVQVDLAVQLEETADGEIDPDPGEAGSPRRGYTTPFRLPDQTPAQAREALGIAGPHRESFEAVVEEVL